MPAISKLSRAEWDEIKEACISGVPVNHVAERYEMEAGTIYVRAHREKWSMPERIRKMVAERSAQGEIPRGLQANPAEGESNVRDCKKGSELIADSLLRNGNAGSLNASNIIARLLQRASDDPSSIAPLKDVGDTVTALKGVRLAAGMDKPEAQAVTVNLAMFSEPEESGWREVSNESP